MAENVSETAVNQDRLDKIADAVLEGARLLSLDPTLLTPAEIVVSLNDYVVNCQKDCNADKDDVWYDWSIPLGALWGAQIVREFGWEWAQATLHDCGDTTAFGVFSPDRAVVIYPMRFIFSCLWGQTPVTIRLAHSMLTDGDIPAFPAGAYQNVMDGVQYIVPPT